MKHIEALAQCIAPEIQKDIMQRLKHAEQEHDVKVLFAVESGSRAWGFASENSDYDVRFVYMHNSDWYLSIDLEQKRDVIEYPIVDDIDINGWDLRKALKLFEKSNPAIVEWIQSPIVYLDTGGFRQAMLQILRSHYDGQKGAYHYLSMAKKNYRGYLRDDYVPLKKYFYVLRPILAVDWLLEHQSTPPIEFRKLMTLVKDNAVSEHIHQLWQRKRLSKEKETIPRVEALNQFIEMELERLMTTEFTVLKSQKNTAVLNQLFRDLLAHN